MRGIIFDAESVRAILAGTKFQTRRVVKPQPPDDCGRIFGPEWYEPVVIDRHGEEVPGDPVYGAYDEWGDWGIKCPMQPGETVYVRETFGLPRDAWGLNPQMRIDIRYRADGERDDYLWRSPLHMPEWAARIHLEITGVRVQRLQDISEYDAEAEGIAVSHYYCDDGEPPDYIPTHRCDPVGKFAARWDEINRKRAPWESNPWVFIYEFRMREL